MSVSKRLSPAMLDALAIVPEVWTRPPCYFRLGGRLVRSPLFHQTFAALQSRGLIEWRNGPGNWEWRRCASMDLGETK